MDDALRDGLMRGLRRFCAMAKAKSRKPLLRIPGVAIAQGLGAWTKEQILCLQDADVPEASFTISPWPKRSEAEAGEFGFGPEVGVNLRPKIETSAVWPLQAQTPTLGIPFRSQAARLLALQATLSHQTVVELPLVAARFRKSWAIDVRDVNRSVSCEPEGQVGVWRIACRFARDAPVQLVVFCGPCARSSARMEIVQGKKRQETDAPWIGLTAEGPLQWVITVRETVDDREPGWTQTEKVQDFVIAAVMGDEEVRWAESGVQRNVRIFGMLLAQATLLTAVALGFVSAPQTWPGLSSASLVLPYLALLAVREDAPVLLQSGFTWWPLSQYPLLLLMEAFALMLIVVVFHGHAALQLSRRDASRFELRRVGTAGAQHRRGARGLGGTAHRAERLLREPWEQFLPPPVRPLWFGAPS
eukprot:g22316.t1